MKKKTRSACAAFVASVIAAVSLLSPINASTAQVGTAVKPSEIEKIIVDFRSVEAFSRNARVYTHTPTDNEPDPNFGGVYSFDADKQAMCIKYAPTSSQAPYRFMMGVTNSALVTDGYRYMVMVYSATTDTLYRLSVWNSPQQGVEAIIAENGSDTNGEWAISSPIDISGVKKGNSILARFLSVNTVSISTNDTEAEFYMKEIGFFKTAEDAELYYSSVDIEKSPLE